LNRDVSVILPIHNQAPYVEGIVAGYEESLRRIQKSYELILVENGSTDGSLAACKRLESASPAVRALQVKDSGWGRAVRVGVAEARGEIICYTNSARTSPPDLLLFLTYATIYPEVVIKANRRIRDSWRRRLGSLLYNLECRTLFDLSVWDINGTPKVFPRQFDKLLRLTRDDDLIDAEFNVTCRREHYPVVEVPILSTTRQGGRSTTSYGSALRMYFGVLKMWRETRRQPS
jgi:glycosyltransferase involved in cell wall biosynthesis